MKTTTTEPWIIIDQATQALRFTGEGRQALAPLFARAGIDIESIKTYPQYKASRKRASPHLMAHLKSIARGDGHDAHTLERRALVALIDDNPDYERLRRQLETRNKLKVII